TLSPAAGMGDADGMTIYVTSDHHFGHTAARTFYRRPFGSLSDMDQAMIERWNDTVEPADEVWHMGDFAVRQSADRVQSLLQALHGRIHLLIGNNDSAAVTGSSGWASVHEYAELVVGGVRLVMCHYPFRTWRDMTKGAINLHGHSHGRLKPLP